MRKRNSGSTSLCVQDDDRHDTIFVMSKENQKSVPADALHFATTRWSIVISAGRTSSPDSRRALESLCETYWYPLYAYVRCRVPDVNEAQDLTQAFFAELLEKNFVGSATPERGRFRAFLLTAFKHFLSKELDKPRPRSVAVGERPFHSTLIPPIRASVSNPLPV